MYAAATEFASTGSAWWVNTGTYMDTPSHWYADGVDLAGLPLSSLVDLPAVVVRTAGRGLTPP